jgi:hypothetical protein
MAAITGSYNTLIGSGSTLPSPSSDNCVVLGGSSSTVYMGGAQGGSGGVTVTSTGLSLVGSTRLLLGSDAGATGASLLSGGNTAAPYWSPVAIPITESTYTMLAKPPALYIVSSSSANTFTLSDPASVPNTVTTVKNSSSFTCTLSRTGKIVDIGMTTAGNTADVPSGAAAIIASNGTNWYVISRQ